MVSKNTFLALQQRRFSSSLPIIFDNVLFKCYLLYWKLKIQCSVDNDLIIPEWLFQLPEIANAERALVLSISDRNFLRNRTSCKSMVPIGIFDL